MIPPFSARSETLPSLALAVKSEASLAPLPTVLGDRNIELGRPTSL
jgi:hypothetical protein